MMRVLDGCLVSCGVAVVFGPYLSLELLGGRGAMTALTGMDLHGAVLAGGYLISWVWLVFLSVPFAVGAVVFLVAGRTR